VKAHPKVLLYAGGIHREYGIAWLTEAFLSADMPGWELHIYGDGNYREALTQIAKTHSQVKYLGLCPNQEVVEAQRRATLLVNPRPTDAEFVKYSFPSKTMECMASGTPLLTTRLPGMPGEYAPYVYFFEEESKEGFTRSLRRFLSLPEEQYFAHGKEARAFVLNEKNNEKQAGKLLEFLRKNYENR
jgi:glycosyltransferase involved in cell wall biosynthesis